MKLLRMRVAQVIEPELVVEPYSIDHQGLGIALLFPMSDRMPVPGRVRIGGMLAPVHEDLTVAVDIAFIKDEVVGGRLDQPPRVRRTARNPERQAEGLR